MQQAKKPKKRPPNGRKAGREGRVARERRAAILLAATRVFLEKGYEAASVDDIIAEAGGSKATIYGHFQNKENLFAEVIREEVRSLEKFLFDPPEETCDVEAALAEFGKRLVEMILSSQAQALHRICLHEVFKFPELGRIFYENGAKMVIDRLAGFLRRAHANGELDVPASELAAWQFTLMCQAKYVHPCCYFGRTAPAGADVRRAIDAAVRTFMAAYGRVKKSSRKSPSRVSARTSLAQ